MLKKSLRQNKQLQIDNEKYLERAISEVEVQQLQKEKKALLDKKYNLELFLKYSNRKLKALYKELTLAEKSQPEAINMILDQYDKDNSGMLNFQEFLRFVKDMDLAGSDDDL